MTKKEVEKVSKSYLCDKRKIFMNTYKNFKSMTKISLLQRINHTKSNLCYATVDDVVKIIREGNVLMNDNEFGDYTLRQAIEHIRSLKTHAEQQQWKLRLLPAVAYNGTFSEVNRNGLIQYSDITALDFDNIHSNDEMCHLWRRLVKTPCVYCVFVTPSGDGLKALVLHDNTDPAMHGDLYNQLLDRFNIVNPDTSCRDLARRNYLSYDPNIWVNPNPVPYHYVPTIKPTIQVQQVRQAQPQNHYAQTGKTISDRSIISIMNSPEYWQEGHRACSIFKLACWFCKWGVDEDLALEYFIGGWESDTMTEDEISGHVTNAYKTEKDNFGTVEFTFYK